MEGEDAILAATTLPTGPYSSITVVITLESAFNLDASVT